MVRRLTPFLCGFEGSVYLLSFLSLIGLSVTMFCFNDKIGAFCVCMNLLCWPVGVPGLPENLEFGDCSDKTCSAFGDLSGEDGGHWGIVLATREGWKEGTTFCSWFKPSPLSLLKLNLFS